MALPASETGSPPPGPDRVPFWECLERRAVEVEVGAVGDVGIVLAVEAPAGLLAVDHRPAQTADVVAVVGVEGGQIVGVIDPELAVLLEERLLREPVEAAASAVQQPWSAPTGSGQANSARAAGVAKSTSYRVWSRSVAELLGCGEDIGQFAVLEAARPRDRAPAVRPRPRRG